MFPWGFSKSSPSSQVIPKLGSSLFLFFDWGPKEVLLLGSAHMALPKKEKKRKYEKIYFISFVFNWMQAKFWSSHEVELRMTLCRWPLSQKDVHRSWNTTRTSSSFGNGLCSYGRFQYSREEPLNKSMGHENLFFLSNNILHGWKRYCLFCLKGIHLLGGSSTILFLGSEALSLKIVDD